MFLKFKLYPLHYCCWCATYDFNCPCLYSDAGILRYKTLEDKIMYIHNNDKQNKSTVDEKNNQKF